MGDVKREKIISNSLDEKIHLGDSLPPPPDEKMKEGMENEQCFVQWNIDTKGQSCPSRTMFDVSNSFWPCLIVTWHFFSHVVKK